MLQYCTVSAPNSLFVTTYLYNNAAAFSADHNQDVYSALLTVKVAVLICVINATHLSCLCVLMTDLCY